MRISLFSGASVTALFLWLIQGVVVVVDGFGFLAPAIIPPPSTIVVVGRTSNKQHGHFSSLCVLSSSVRDEEEGIENAAVPTPTNIDENASGEGVDTTSVLQEVDSTVATRTTATARTTTNATPFTPSTPPPTATRMSATSMMQAMGTSPRRVALSFLSASGIALAGNFLGITSQLLTNIPEDTVEASGVDTYFPRGDFKRCRSNRDGYTFVIPKEWVADTFVELAKAQRQVQPLDYQMSSSNKRAGGGGTLPDAAYGPPGRLNQKGVSESGDTNVSVIVTSGLQGFSLRKTLGPPQTGAESLLRLSIAPPGSGRVATLVDAFEDTSRGNNKNSLVYQFEYIVDRGERGPPLRNISVVAASALGDKLYTLTVVAPLAQWNKDPVFESKLRKIASSFHLTSS